MCVALLLVCTLYMKVLVSVHLLLAIESGGGVSTAEQDPHGGAGQGE